METFDKSVEAVDSRVKKLFMQLDMEGLLK